jgi:hypothetical protein
MTSIKRLGKDWGRLRKTGGRLGKCEKKTKMLGKEKKVNEDKNKKIS